jgi:predicted nicotinamide N-methyase
MHTFVLSHTKLTTLPFLPSIKLHLADEVVPVWESSALAAPPFWAFAWAGGQALARYILDHPEAVRGKRVLDLASGSGLVAIAAAQAGAAQVTAVEIDAIAVKAMEINADANEVRINIHLGDILDTTVDTQVILAGDVFYSRDMSNRVLSFFERSNAEQTLVGDPGRAYAPKSGYDTVAEYTVPVNRDVESTDHKRAVVLRARYGT